MAAIKNCPFCGQAPEVDKPTGGLGSHYWEIACYNNDCPTNPVTRGKHSEEEAVQAWNTRLPVPTLRTDLEKWIAECEAENEALAQEAREQHQLPWNQRKEGYDVEENVRKSRSNNITIGTLRDVLATLSVK